MSTNTLPISRKALNGFLQRIRQAYSLDPEKTSAMERALHLYLDNDNSYQLAIPDTDRTAFEFLRHEIDTAIERSRRARERARMRREMIASRPASLSPITTDINNDNADDSPIDGNATGFRLSRSQRREQQRNVHRISNKKRNKRLCPLPSKSTSK